VGDPNRMQQCLKVVSYYRLSGYWYPFRRSDNTFKPDTSFAEVWTRYAFDRQLRLLVMDAIERIEVAVRSKLAHHASKWIPPVSNDLVEYLYELYGGRIRFIMDSIGRLVSHVPESLPGTISDEMRLLGSRASSNQASSRS